MTCTFSVNALPVLAVHAVDKSKEEKDWGKVGKSLPF
jgi:hypothetical protein